MTRPRKGQISIDTTTSSLAVYAEPSSAELTLAQENSTSTGGHG